MNSKGSLVFLCFYQLSSSASNLSEKASVLCFLRLASLHRTRVYHHILFFSITNFGLVLFIPYYRVIWGSCRNQRGPISLKRSVPSSNPTSALRGGFFFSFSVAPTCTCLYTEEAFVFGS